MRTATLFLPAILAMVACDTGDDERPVAEEIRDIGQDFGRDGGDPLQEAGEAIDQMGEAITNKDRETVADKADEAVDDFSRWIDAQIDDPKGKSALNRAEDEQLLRDARTELRRIGEDIEDLGDATEAEWDEATADIQARLQAIRDDLRDR